MTINNYLYNINVYNDATINYYNNCVSVHSECNSGICTDLFTSLEDCLNIHITGEIKNSDDEIYFRLCLYNNENAEKDVVLQKIKTDSDNNFDQAYEFVYI